MNFNIFKLLKSAPPAERLTDPNLIDKTYKYWRIRTLYSMYIGYACFYFTRKSFTFVVPEMISSLHFSKAEIGILGSAFYITYGCSKFLSGMLSDRSNPRYFMAIGLIITGIVNICFGFSSSLFFLALFWIINGFFQGWGWPPCARLLTHWYHRSERGIWWGIWNTSHNVGGALIPIIVGVAVAVSGNWRAAMFVPGVIAIVLGLFLLNRLRDVPTAQGLPPIEEYKKSDVPEENVDKLPIFKILVRYVLKNRYIWLLAFSYTLVYIVRTAINDWGAVFLTEHGYSLMSADSCMSFFEIGGFFGSLVAGWGSDKIFKGKRGPVNVLFSLGIVFSIWGFWAIPTQSFILHAFLVFIIGFLVFGPQMLIGMAAAELSHREAAGTATGFVGLFAYIGAAISGYPVGLITQHWGWIGFFIGIGICAVLSVFLLLPLWSAVTHPNIAAVSNED